MADSYKGRIDEALEALVRASEHTFRGSGEGQLIERLGCILAGRKSSWWPKGDGSMPEFNYIPTKPVHWDEEMRADAQSIYDAEKNKSEVTVTVHGRPGESDYIWYYRYKQALAEHGHYGG